VFVPVDFIIGGRDMAGEGWRTRWSHVAFTLAKRRPGPRAGPLRRAERPAARDRSARPLRAASLAPQRGIRARLRCLARRPRRHAQAARGDQRAPRRRSRLAVPGLRGGEAVLGRRPTRGGPAVPTLVVRARAAAGPGIPARGARQLPEPGHGRGAAIARLPAGRPVPAAVRRPRRGGGEGARRGRRSALAAHRRHPRFPARRSRGWGRSRRPSARCRSPSRRARVSARPYGAERSPPFPQIRSPSGRSRPV
jgi:hypothetical protein